MTEILLADGATVGVRAIREDDAAALRAFHAALSPESIVLRFFGPHPRLSDSEVERFTHVDGVDRVALVVEGETGIVAVARFDRSPGGDEAEVAFVVGRRTAGSRDSERSSCSGWRMRPGPAASGGSWPTPSRRTSGCSTSFATPGSPGPSPGPRRSCDVVMDIGSRPGHPAPS